MPNIRAAIKCMRSDAKKRLRNQATLSEIKTLNKKLTTLAQDRPKAEELARLLISKYDRAVLRGMMPRGRADRRKSRITAFLKKVKQA